MYPAAILATVKKNITIITTIHDVFELRAWLIPKPGANMFEQCN